MRSLIKKWHAAVASITLVTALVIGISPMLTAGKVSADAVPTTGFYEYYSGTPSNRLSNYVEGHGDIAKYYYDHTEDVDFYFYVANRTVTGQKQELLIDDAMGMMVSVRDDFEFEGREPSESELEAIEEAKKYVTVTPLPTQQLDGTIYKITFKKFFLPWADRGFTVKVKVDDKGMDIVDIDKLQEVCDFNQGTNVITYYIQLEQRATGVAMWWGYLENDKPAPEVFEGRYLDVWDVSQPYYSEDGYFAVVDKDGESTPVKTLASDIKVTTLEGEEVPSSDYEFVNLASEYGNANSEILEGRYAYEFHKPGTYVVYFDEGKMVFGVSENSVVTYEDEACTKYYNMGERGNIHYQPVSINTDSTEPIVLYLKVTGYYINDMRFIDLIRVGDQEVTAIYDIQPLAGTTVQAIGDGLYKVVLEPSKMKNLFDDEKNLNVCFRIIDTLYDLGGYGDYIFKDVTPEKKPEDKEPAVNPGQTTGDKEPAVNPGQTPGDKDTTGNTTTATPGGNDNTVDNSDAMTQKPATNKKDVVYSVSCKKGAKKITGKITYKKATVKVKIGKKAYKKATVKGKKFTFKCSKLKKGTKIKIKISQKGKKTVTKSFKVK